MKHHQPDQSEPLSLSPLTGGWKWPAGGLVLIAWLLVVCYLPDPRPLSAPDWFVRGLQSMIGLSDPFARAASTILLRGLGFAMIGVLLAVNVRHWSLVWAAPTVLLVAPVVAVASQWINFGYFPLAGQVQLSVVTAIMGGLIGLTLRRNLFALGILVVFAIGVFMWGTATNVSNDLDAAARSTGLYLLSRAEEIPAGDAGFEKLMQAAFSYAEDNSHGTDAVFPNRAAILALAVIVGEERLADVVRRPIGMARLDEINRLRRRITIRSRSDLARHFWVSAGLVVVTDEGRAMTIGIGKEMMDSTPGGSGFSFVDMLANRAGILFATAATNDPSAARNIQLRIIQGLVSDDFLPDFTGLPEGISDVQFRAEFGGLRGEKTRQINEEIDRRLSTANGLQ